MKIVTQAPVTTRKPSQRTEQKSLEWTFETVLRRRWMTQLRWQSVLSVRSECRERSATECNSVFKAREAGCHQPNRVWNDPRRRQSTHSLEIEVDRRPTLQTLVSKHNACISVCPHKNWQLLMRNWCNMIRIGFVLWWILEVIRFCWHLTLIFDLESWHLQGRTKDA